MMPLIIEPEMENGTSERNFKNLKNFCTIVTGAIAGMLVSTWLMLCS